jgi:hypothetical protein
MAPRNRATSTQDTPTTSTEDITAPATTDPAQQQIAVPEPNYGDDTLRSITSFQDAINAAGYMFGAVEDAADVLGDGFRLLKTEDGKSKLVGKPLMLLEWSFYPSDEFGGEFAAIRLVAQEDNNTISKYIVNDGSTGVCKMLREYTEHTGRRGGLMVRNGFRESSYPFCQDCRTAVDDDHKKFEPSHVVGRGKTYYIDTSA